MLQLIIWLGCLLLILNGLKALQIGAAAEAGSLSRTIGVISAVLGVAGALAFFLMASTQSDYANDGYSDAQIMTRFVGTMDTAEQARANLSPEQKALYDRYTN